MNIHEKKEMGLRIRFAREKMGFTQDDIAAKLGLNRATISSYEAGRAVPPSNILKGMSSALKVSADFLLGLDSEDNKVKSDTDNGYQDIGNAIRAEREFQKLTQQEVANYIGEPQTKISQYERDIVPIPSKTMDKLMELYGLSFPEFLNKYNMWDGDIHPHFEGDVNRQIAFEKAREQDAMNDPDRDKIQTIAAHHDGDDWTEEELEEIEEFKRFVLSKRKQQR